MEGSDQIVRQFADETNGGTLHSVNIGDVTLEKLGVEKKWKDIIEYGAVLISDEAIAWISPAPRGDIKPSPKKDDGKESKTNGLADTLKKKASELIDSAVKATDDTTEGD
jgi:hypothetical protein